MSEKNNEKTKKEGFFKKILKSVKDFDKYEDFALEKSKEAFKYLIKLVALFCAIVCIAYTYRILDNINKLYTDIKDKIPEFSYENGELKTETEEATIIEDYGELIGSIVIDTKSDNITEEYSEQISKYGQAILFAKDKLIIINSGINGQVSYKYSDILSQYSEILSYININSNNFNKQEIIQGIDNLNVVSLSFDIYIIMFIWLFIVYFISIMIDVLILSLLAYIISRFTRIRLKYAPSFNVAVHAITLPVILNLTYIIINLFTGFEIKYFQLMYNTISYIYVIVAILMIKTDFLNRQAELIKIAQEQMKIKEELKKQEDQEKKNKEKDNDDKPVEKDNKEPKEKKGEGADNSVCSDKETTKEKKQTKKKKEKSKDSSEEPLGDASCDVNE